MTEPRELSLVHAGELMRRGRLTAEALVVSCLERIEVRQGEIKAWVVVHPESALERARELDAEAANNRWHGPLHGIPLGIKDIIDVRGMETRGGTEAHPVAVPERDAPCVEQLREAGAIFLGKLATTAFAYVDPAETRNPWNTEHSPGGSSSGSGAAVADRMCMAALGTQTGGSVLRPAVFNGLVGFKGGLGTVDTAGVIPLSEQLDHVGVLARSVEDAHLVWQVMRKERHIDWQSTLTKMSPALLPKAPAKIWRVRDFFETEAEPESLLNLEQATLALQEHGAKILEGPLPESFAGQQESFKAIMAGDAAAYHRDGYAERKHLYPPEIASLVELGLEGKAVDYIRARGHRARMRRDITTALAMADVAIMPTCPTPPPHPGTTGSSRFNSPWSLCGIPAITLPTRVIDGNLPMGVQLIARPGQEEALMQMAGWCESIFRFDQAPG